jgi:glutamate-5-semialdehyde dehydrogenase
MESVVDQLRAAREAARSFVICDAEKRNALLCEIAARLRAEVALVLAENAIDVTALPDTDPRKDRLLLTSERVMAIADAVEAVTRLPEVLDEELEHRVMPSGIDVRRVRVPLGVVGCIYEARPNVTVDVATLCLRTGNAVVLKGGREAERTNRELVALMRDVLAQQGLPIDLVTLLAPTHEAAEALMQADGLVDALIPRGSARLIQAVREKARVPVIETGAGVCHIYVHADANLQQAAQIIANAKTRRVSVCNALDCLLVHRAVADELETLLAPCRAQGVVVHDAPADWGTEWLSLHLSVRVVDSLDEALAHIAQYGSGHSEAILTRDEAAAARFCREVDAACVYVNTPTSFTDGGEFGLGAEVGISTQKLHARGPMGLAALTTFKWLIKSDGALRGK